ncbi:MAG TPA: helix-turn-helix transcriptional regulator [Desulfatiglandales bacterium]|nr:helix-turn-helix transcriptional regulator [Desulfatiglandales bacterium]
MNLRLKTKILESGKPQIALAREIGIPEPILSKVVNGWIEPKADLRNKIAQALNCKTEEIFPQTREINKVKTQ